MPIPTTQDFSVKFGRSPDMGLEGQKAFPFLYSFVNKNDDTWEPNAAPPSLSCIGPTVPANSKIIHNVLLDPDYNFKLLSIKYEGYSYNLNGEQPYYFWYNSPTGTFVTSDGYDPGMDWIGTPLTHYIGMTLSLQGSGSTIVYGGLNTQPQIYRNQDRIPIEIDSIQGYDYGHYAIRTPYLLPREGHLVFEITNSFSFPITVAAAIYGMKVRL